MSVLRPTTGHPEQRSGQRPGHAAQILWSNLPVLVIGSALVAIGWSVVRALSPHLGWASIVGIALLVVPAFAVLLRGCEVLLTDEHFGVADLVRTGVRTLLPSLKVTAVPTLALLLTVSGYQLWLVSGQAWMLISVGLGAVVSLVALYTGVVALPYVVRTGAPLRTGWLVSFYIATRNPVPVLAVLSAVALGAWAAAYLSFAVIVLIPAPLALVWAAAVAGATERSLVTLASREGRPAGLRSDGRGAA
jgi:hypothetical protein